MQKSNFIVTFQNVITDNKADSSNKKMKKKNGGCLTIICHVKKSENKYL